MRYFRKSWLTTAGAALLFSSCGGARALVNIDVIGDAPFSSGSTLILSDGTAVSKTFPDVIIDSVTSFHAGLYLPSGVSGIVTITATMEMAACVTGRGQVTIPGVAAGQSTPTIELLVSHVTCQPLPNGTGGMGVAGGHGGVGGPVGAGGGSGQGTGGVTQGAGGDGQGTGGTSGLGGGGPGSGGSSGVGGSSDVGVGGAPGTGGSGVGGAVMGTGGAPAVTCANDLALIDNMESGTGNICASNGRSGYWFSYVDASSTLSPGTVPTPPTVLPAPRGASLRAVHISGTLAAGGTSHYAGVGCFMDTVPTTYNATGHGYSGIQFYAMGTASAPTLIVQNTATEAEIYYGTCTAPMTTNCIGNFAPISGLSPNQWISVSIPFTAISGGSAAFMASDIWSIEFQPGPGAYDLWIDDLSFY